jgi:hypothetical protein
MQIIGPPGHRYARGHILADGRLEETIWGENLNLVSFRVNLIYYAFYSAEIIYMTVSIIHRDHRPFAAIEILKSKAGRP